MLFEFHKAPKAEPQTPCSCQSPSLIRKARHLPVAISAGPAGTPPGTHLNGFHFPDSPQNYSNEPITFIPGNQRASCSVSAHSKAPHRPCWFPLLLSVKPPCVPVRCKVSSTHGMLPASSARCRGCVFSHLGLLRAATPSSPTG